MDYKAPNSIDEAVKLLAEAKGAARVLAGGTDLLVQIRAGLAKPPLVVDVKNIPELRKISTDSDGIHIGDFISDPRDLFLLCNSCSLPGKRISTTEAGHNHQDRKSVV